VLHGSTYRKSETAQWLVYHYDLFSRTLCYVYRRPWADERSFVSVQQRALPTVQCSRRHKFAIHHCCATLNIFIQLAVTCNFISTQRMHCCVPTATMVTRTRHNVTSHVHCTSCSLCHNVQTSSEVQ